MDRRYKYRLVNPARYYSRECYIHDGERVYFLIPEEHSAHWLLFCYRRQRETPNHPPHPTKSDFSVFCALHYLSPMIERREIIR